MTTSSSYKVRVKNKFKKEADNQKMKMRCNFDRKPKKSINRMMKCEQEQIYTKIKM
jgi:hypothetical protein